MSLPLLKQCRKRLGELIQFSQAKLDYMSHIGQAPGSEIAYGRAYVRELHADMAPLEAEIARLEKES